MNNTLLNELYSEKYEDVIWKFMDSYNISFEKSKEIFIELTKFLSLSSTKKNIFIDKDIVVIDEMWHVFLLFTQEYHDFCVDNFGYFIHHVPTSKEEKDRFKDDLENNAKKLSKKVLDKTKSQYSLIYDLLGRDTLIKWFDEYATIYSPENLKKLRK